MNRSCALFGAALALACALWLATFLGMGDNAPVVASSQEYTVVFQYEDGVYEGVADTYLNYYKQPDNFGGSQQLWVTSDDKARTLARFDLAEHIQPGAQVTSATLTLRVDVKPSSSLDLLCYKVKQHWIEDEATWREARAGGDQWDGCGASIREDNKVCQLALTKYMSEVTLDLTEVVQMWVDNPEANHGVLLVGQKWSSNVTPKFASSNYSVRSARPALKVIYEGAPAPYAYTDADAYQDRAAPRLDDYHLDVDRLEDEQLRVEGLGRRGAHQRGGAGVDGLYLERDALHGQAAAGDLQH